MIKLFVKKNRHEIELSEDLLLIPEFAEVIKADKSKDKLEAEKQLKYIYFVYDFNSYCFNLEEAVRIQEAIKACKLEKDFKPLPLLQTAIKKYLEIQENSIPTLKLLRDAYTNLNNIGTFLKNIDYNKVDKLGRPLHSPDTSMNTLTKVGKVHESIKTLEKQVMMEISGEANIRGGGVKGEFEDGMD